MFRRFFYSSAALLISAAGLRAADTVSGPALGLVFDPPTGSVRELTGSLGGASLGPALVAGVAFATGAPQGTHGIACNGEECFVFARSGVRTPIAESAQLPDGAAWSADGRTAAIFSKSGQWVRAIGGLADAVDAQAPVSVASLGGEIAGVALNANGSRLFVAVAGEHPAVWELASGTFIPVLTGGNPAALAISNDGKTLLVLDGAAHTISEVPLNGGPVTSWPVTEGASALAPGQGVLYVLSGQGLIAYDAATHRPVEETALEFVPGRLERLASGSFLLNARASAEDLLWSFAAGRGVYFVPVTPVESGGDEAAQKRVRR